MTILRSFGKSTVQLESEDSRTHFGVLLKNSRIPNPNQLAENGNKMSGFIVEGNELQAWDMNNITEIDGQVYAYGEFHTGMALSEVLQMKTAANLPYLLRMTAAFEVLKKAGVLPLRLLTDSIYFTEDGKVLFLPDELVDRILSTATEMEKIQIYQRFSHPDLHEKRYSFWLGSMAYLLLTGQVPYSSESEEELRERMRTVEILSPRQIRPEIRASVSDFIMQSLGKGAGSLPDLTAWQAQLQKWNDEGVTESINEQEKQMILEKAQKQIDRIEKKFRIKKFLNKRGRLIAIVALIVIAVGAFIGNIIRHKTAPPETIGMSQTEVIDLLYDSINVFDHAMIEDCFTRDAGKMEVNEATYLFVMTKQMEAYEGSSGYIDAQLWHDSGRPDLRGRGIVYGIINPVITPKEGTQDTFFVEYERWIIHESEADYDFENQEPVYSEPFRMKDEIIMVYNEKRDYWAISERTILEQELIETGE